MWSGPCHQPLRSLFLGSHAFSEAHNACVVFPHLTRLCLHLLAGLWHPIHVASCSMFESPTRAVT